MPTPTTALREEIARLGGDVERLEREVASLERDAERLQRRARILAIFFGVLVGFAGALVSILVCGHYGATDLERAAYGGGTFVTLTGLVLYIEEKLQLF
ncbi:hypothetical protein ACFUIT_39780 [Streptomyces sp. NPDC057239]|uniref:hypothetical protein n=1 Tax=Streptomyces sp. NPDC057239 TaxID=3346061 RepID=UPI00362518AA